MKKIKNMTLAAVFLAASPAVGADDKQALQGDTPETLQENTETQALKRDPFMKECSTGFDDKDRLIACVTSLIKDKNTLMAELDLVMKLDLFADKYSDSERVDGVPLAFALDTVLKHNWQQKCSNKGVIKLADLHQNLSACLDLTTVMSVRFPIMGQAYTPSIDKLRQRNDFFKQSLDAWNLEIGLEKV